MRFEKPTFYRVRRYFNVFAPKSAIQFGCVLVYAVSFLLIVLPRLLNPAGKLVLAAMLTAFIVGGLLLPSSVINFWERIWFFPRAAIAAVFAYVLTVTLGWLPDIVRSPSAWQELLVLSGGAPFSSAHGLGLFAMIPAFLSQWYFPNSGHAGFPEQFIRGTPEVIAWERAVSIMEEIGESCGWEAEPKEAPKPQPALQPQRN